MHSTCRYSFERNIFRNYFLLFFATFCLFSLREKRKKTFCEFIFIDFIKNSNIKHKILCYKLEEEVFNIAFKKYFFSTFFNFTIYSACKSNLMQSFSHKYGSVREIPPFKGLVSINMYSKIVDTIKKSNTG